MNSTPFRDLLSRRTAIAGLSIGGALMDRLETYFRLLARWNARINLTGFSLDSPSAHAIDRLFIEPLAAAQALNDSADVWIDLGSGGGSPAIPMQLWRPAKLLMLIESKERKAAFLREVARELCLEEVQVEVTRIESITTRFRLTKEADLVTVRAVRVSAELFNAFRVLLRPEGRVVLFGSRPLEPGIRNDFRVERVVDVATGGSIAILAKA